MLRVLVIEDNPVERHLTSTRVEKAGHKPTGVAGVIESLEMLDHDIALLDLGLDRSQGLETVRMFRRLHPHMPVVVLTSDDEDEHAAEAIRMGADDFLVKHEVTVGSIRRALLLAAIRRRTWSDQHECPECIAAT